MVNLETGSGYCAYCKKDIQDIKEQLSDHECPEFKKANQRIKTQKLLEKYISDQRWQK